MKRFTPGAAVAPGTFLVAEQMPGNVTAVDMSAHLQRETYWASYNVAALESVRDRTGYTAWAGDVPFFQWATCPRGQAFAAEQGTVRDVATLRRVMGLNQYTTAPYALVPNCTEWNGTAEHSACVPSDRSATLAIAARYDLNPVNGTFGPVGDKYGLGHWAYGAIDVKLTSYTLMTATDNLQAHAISGPTYSNDDTPVFNWSTYTPDVPGDAETVHLGMPDNFHNAYVQFSIRSARGATVVPGPPPAARNWVPIIIGIAGAAVVVAAISAYLITTCRGGDGRSKGQRIFDKDGSERVPLV